MDKKINQTQVDSPEGADLENRREVVRRLGKYAAYAAPFTLLAANLKADTTSGGGPNAKHASGKR